MGNGAGGANFCLCSFVMISRFCGIRRCDSVKRSKADALLCPGARIAGAEPLPLSGAIFLLCVLGSVSFDGLSKTFLWLGANGINPLEFPGRSAVVGIKQQG